jgi:hypothetical protein
VQFQGTFGGEYDVPALEGTSESLGCVPNPANLIAWDVTTAVSETYVSVNGNHVDSIANVGCGTVKGSYGRLSLLPYDLEVTPDTYGPTITSETPVLTTGNDAVFARLMDSLVDDLGYVFHELACKQVDPVPNGGPAPLPADVCSPDSTASDHLMWIRLKLDRCLAGSFISKEEDDAKGIHADRLYCQSFLDRLTYFQQALPATTPSHDVANRVGELKSRVDILRHIHTTRFLPSIPDGGFCSERNGCAPPWPLP